MFLVQRIFFKIYFTTDNYRKISMYTCSEQTKNQNWTANTNTQNGWHLLHVTGFPSKNNCSGFSDSLDWSSTSGSYYKQEDTNEKCGKLDSVEIKSEIFLSKYQWNSLKAASVFTHNNSNILIHNLADAKQTINWYKINSLGKASNGTFVLLQLTKYWNIRITAVNQILAHLYYCI